MNKTILMGRMVRDPELKTTNSQTPVVSFTLAVERKFKDANGERQADFIPCVAWRQLAEIIAKHFRKGSRIIVAGAIQTRNWDDTEGKKHYATEVIVDEFSFVDSKGSQQQSGGDQAPAQAAPAASDPGFFPAPDDDTSLPFEL